MNPETILEYLISKGIITQEEFDRRVKEQEKISSITKIKEKVKTPQERYSEVFSNADSTIEELKLARINLLKDECSKAIYDGFVATNGKSYGFNEHDQANFTQQMLLMIQDTNNTITNIQWKTKDDGIVAHTKSEFNQVIQDAKNHKFAMQQKYWDLEQQILDALDKDTIDNVKW